MHRKANHTATKNTPSQDELDDFRHLAHRWPEAILACGEGPALNIPKYIKNGVGTPEFWEEMKQTAIASLWRRSQKLKIISELAEQDYSNIVDDIRLNIADEFLECPSCQPPSCPCCAAEKEADIENSIAHK